MRRKMSWMAGETVWSFVNMCHTVWFSDESDSIWGVTYIHLLRILPSFRFLLISCRNKKWRKPISSLLHVHSRRLEYKIRRLWKYNFIERHKCVLLLLLVWRQCRWHYWELQYLLPNPNVLVADTKCMRAVNLCTNKILQFLTGGFSLQCCYTIIAFSALTLLVVQQEEHPACKKIVVGCWRGYLSGARCRLAYGPADAAATHCLLLQ